MRPMSADEYRAAIARLGFIETDVPNDTGQSNAARFFDRDARTGRLWAANGPPAPVAIALRLMLKAKISVSRARKLLEEWDG